MNRVPLIAITSLKYAGKRRSPGEPFDATRKDARALTFIKKAKYEDTAPTEPAQVTEPEPQTPEPEAVAASAEYETAAMTPEPEAEQEPRTRRTYKRRDLSAKKG